MRPRRCSSANSIAANSSKWLGSSTNDHAELWDLQPQPNDLMLVLHRPLEPANVKRRIGEHHRRIKAADAATWQETRRLARRRGDDPGAIGRQPAATGARSSVARNAAWWAEVTRKYDLDGHHFRLLETACEAWDIMKQAREALRLHGLTHIVGGAVRARPENAILRESRVGFCRALRELGLDEAEGEKHRSGVGITPTAER